MMKKPMAKKAMPAKKGAAKMAAKPAMPMMKKGGMAKKYNEGGALGPPKKRASLGVLPPPNNILPKGGPLTGYTSGYFPGDVRFSKPAPRPAPEKPSMPKMDRKNSPLRDGTYRKGGKATMRKGGKSC